LIILNNKFKPEKCENNFFYQDWHGFEPTYLLEFSDPLFQKIGTAFINEYQAEFGPSDHLYNCDTFNEMDPSSNDPEYLRKSGQAVYGAMTEADPKAIWVMQGWLFIQVRLFKRTTKQPQFFLYPRR
jgi:alpha-N-acetylglucosaminidase